MKEVRVGKATALRHGPRLALPDALMSVTYRDLTYWLFAIRWCNRSLLCSLYVELDQNCEALQLFWISKLHELHFALPNGCGINRFREARIVDKTGWRLTLPGRPGCEGLFQNVGCDRNRSTCRHVKSIHAQELGCQSHATPGGRFQAFVHQP